MVIKDKLLKRKKVVQVKIETDEGTAETEGFTDCLVYGPCMEPEAPGPAGMGTFTCSAKLGGHGLAIKDPGVAIMCRGCGLKKESEAYTAPGKLKTITIRLFEDDLKKTLSSTLGSVAFDGKPGKWLTAHFELSGILSTEKVSKADLATIEKERKEG